MPYNDNAVILPAVGYIYTNEVNTASPTVSDIENYTANGTVAGGWLNAGHTSLDDLPEPGFEGGDQEVIGTWQNRVMRSITSETPVDSLLIRFAQWDSNILSFYYGQANTSGEAGRFRVASTPVSSIERALLMIIVDGQTNVAFYSPKASLKRDDAIELSVDSFALLPVRATLLQGTDGPAGPPVLFDWISADTAIVGS